MTPLTLGPYQRSQLVDDLPGLSAGVVELLDSFVQLFLPLSPGFAIATLTLLVTLTLTVILTLLMFLRPLTVLIISMLTSIVAAPLERNWLCHVSHLLSVEK